MEANPIQASINANGSTNERPASSGKHALDTSVQAAQPRSTVDHSNDSLVTSPISSPPYWVQSHQRRISNISVETIADGAITLQDNTDGEDTKNKACWAKNVYIEDFIIINESRTNIGAFVTWNITVETLQVSTQPALVPRWRLTRQGGSLRVRKRYSEFDDLKERLLQTFPNSRASMPPLPPKSLISKFRPKFLENRRAGLQYFLK